MKLSIPVVIALAALGSSNPFEIHATQGKGVGLAEVNVVVCLLCTFAGYIELTSSRLVNLWVAHALLAMNVVVITKRKPSVGGSTVPDPDGVWPVKSAASGVIIVKPTMIAVPGFIARRESCLRKPVSSNSSLS